MENIVLIKTNNYYYYHRNNNLYSLHLASKQLLRQARDYSLKMWYNYVYRMIESKKAVEIKDIDLISKFEQKSIMIDESPSIIFNWDIS